MAESRPWLERLREAFGIRRHQPSGEQPVVLRVFLAIPNGGSVPSRHLVGTLSSEGDKWTFRYDAQYAQSDRPAISAFPNKRSVYQSPVLWPFFAVRLPPLDREDVKRAVEERGLRDLDEIHLLGALSKRAVTSPYEFELAAA